MEFPPNGPILLSYKESMALLDFDAVEHAGLREDITATRAAFYDNNARHEISELNLDVQPDVEAFDENQPYYACPREYESALANSCINAANKILFFVERDHRSGELSHHDFTEFVFFANMFRVNAQKIRRRQRGV